MEFIQPNEQRHLFPELPSVAMLFNGRLLEEEIEGYRTLNVSGRETIGYDMETSGQISGRDGELFLNKTIPARMLTIQYELKAETNHEFQDKFRALNWLLHSEDDVPIKFRDEMDVTYYGQLSNMEPIPPESNSVISTFELYCPDPYKYEGGFVARGNPVDVLMMSPYKVKPDEIVIELKSNETKITVDNITTGRHIILNGTYNAGDTIRINIKENKITRNNQNIKSHLDFMESDFHRFTVKDEDRVSVTPSNAEVALMIRGRWK